MRASIWIRLVAAAGLTVLGLWPGPASADSQSVNVDNVAEAWYAATASGSESDAEDPLPVPTDPCTLPIGCPPELPLPAPVPTDSAPSALVYPVGTLHIEASLGQETAHAYVVPDLSRVPEGTTTTGGTLLLPLSREDQAGNVSVETARAVACLVTEEVTDKVVGGTSDAPTYDCEAATSKLRLDEKGKAFTVNLEPFLTAWRDGAPVYGVALVPASDLGPQATWALTVNGDSVEKGKPARSTILYRAIPGPEGPPVEEPEAPAAPEPAPNLPGLPPLPPLKTPPVAAAPTAEVPQGTALPGQLAPAPMALLNSPWYTYRGVVFLPLAFLLALSLTGRSLTRPFGVVSRRRGRLGLGGLDQRRT